MNFTYFPEFISNFLVHQEDLSYIAERENGRNPVVDPWQMAIAKTVSDLYYYYYLNYSFIILIDFT